MALKIQNGGLLKRNPVYCGLVFGQPGSGKSTLAASASKPILIDLDLGAQRIATKDRSGLDVVRCETYADLVETVNAPELKNYNTIIIDTFGQIVDVIMRDKFGGTMNPAKWGFLKSEFMQLVNTLRLTGKSVLFLAHESEEKNDEKIIKRPQCQGKAKDELMKVLDFIGYIHNGNNGVKLLEFGGDDSFYSKNTLGFENKYTLPDVKLGQNDFWRATIETRIAEYLEEQEKADTELLEQMEGWELRIKEQCSEPADFEKFVADLKTAEGLSGGAIVRLKSELVKKGKEIGIIFNAESKKWEKQEA